MENKSDKGGSGTMLYITLWSFGASLNRPSGAVARQNLVHPQDERDGDRLDSDGSDTPATERMFEASFNATLDRYRQLLGQLGTGQPDLPNANVDTGKITGPGKYRLNDETPAKLLDALARQNFSGASPETRAELLESLGIRMLRMRLGESQKSGRKSWANLNN